MRTSAPSSDEFTSLSRYNWAPAMTVSPTFALEAPPTQPGRRLRSPLTENSPIWGPTSYSANRACAGGCRTDLRERDSPGFLLTCPPENSLPPFPSHVLSAPCLVGPFRSLTPPKARRPVRRLSEATRRALSVVVPLDRDQGALAL